MSLIFATQLAAVGTAVLALFAIITAVFAFLAFRKQSKEVKDQADMLRVQSERLEVYRKQVDEQRRTSTEQMKVLGLQAAEIRASLAERRSAQASKVFIWTEVGPDPRISQAERAVRGPADDVITANVKNASDRPIYSAELLWDDGSSALSDIAVRSGAKRLARVLMPDADDTGTRDTGPDARAVVLRFRDAAGFSWLRGPEGELLDLSARAESGAAETNSASPTAE